MNTTLDLFNQWSKKSDNVISHLREKKAVVYTRVSSKEQYETNLSLDWQKKAIEEFAQRSDFNISGYFGGVYESAKTDGRKEFLRMLEFVKRKKGEVTHILVYLLDRFSRTGGGAIKLAKDLREKYGVTIIAVTQPIDTSNPGGVFQQNIQFLFGEYDNQLRRQRAMAGMKEKFQRGIWCIKPPMGYSIVYLNKDPNDDRSKGDRRIIVNETGKKLKKAFNWKIEGMKNDEIIERLQALGVKIYKQKLSMIFSNPFYAGIIANKMLEGKLVEGKHEKLISHEVFLQVNNIRANAGGKYGVTHRKEVAEAPLKLFMKCDKCGRGYTSYQVEKENKTKQKQIYYYYKCRTKGCNCNKNVDRVNQEFITFLSGYSIQSQLVAPVLYHMNYAFDKHYGMAFEQQKTLAVNLTDLQKKMDDLDEDFYIGKKIPAETYDRLRSKLVEEKRKILESLATFNVESSNLKGYYSSAIQLSTKLATVWTSNETPVREKLQKMIFPNGVSYNHQNGTFLTENVNEVFAPIAGLNRISGGDKEEQDDIKAILSSQVGTTRFELATPCTPCKWVSRTMLIQSLYWKGFQWIATLFIAFY